MISQHLSHFNMFIALTASHFLPILFIHFLHDALFQDKSMLLNFTRHVLALAGGNSATLKRQHFAERNPS